MSGNLLTFPILIPMVAGVLAFLLPKSRAWQISISVLASLGLLLTALALFYKVSDGTIISITFGSWQAPFGIVFVADLLSAIMVLITALILLATSLYAYADMDVKRLRYNFVCFLQFMICGICGAFLTGDIFNLYVCFEIMLITSFALLSLGGETLQLYGTLKYIALNLIATVLLLSGIGLLYGLTGTLNMADIARIITTAPGAFTLDPFLFDMIAIIFIVAFGIKAAVFPLFFWLPASYHLPPVTVSAVFAGLLTKVGVYAFMRLFTLVFTHHIDFTHTLLLWMAGLTMISGVLGAVIQNNIRRILSFHIISQIGYMVMGLALFTVQSLIGTIFYIVHHIIVKANLFFISGLIRRITGSFSLDKTGGLYRAVPIVSMLFLISAFSLAGFPPLSGFWAKFTLIKAGLTLGKGWIVAVALFTGLYTIISMTKIWNEAFWKNPSRTQKPLVRPVWSLEWIMRLAPCILLALCTLIIGLFPAYFFKIADQAAQQLLTPEPYIQSVLHHKLSKGSNFSS